MGNRHSNKVHASEPQQAGFMDSFKAAFSAASSSANSQENAKNVDLPLPNLPPVDGAGDAKPHQKEVDPKTIPSSIPSLNPGSWNEIHKFKELLPMPFDGGKLTISKGLSNHFQVNHNFTLGTMQPSGYKFGATYVGSKQLSQSETFPVMLGEMDPSGNLSAQIIHAFTRQTRSRLVSQFQGNKMAALEMGTDYRGESVTASLTAANPDLIAGTGIFVAQCLYAARPNLALGVEGLFHRGMNPSIRQVATNVSASLVAKYTAEKWSSTIQVAPLEKGLHASYCHKLNDNQSIGVEIEGKGAAGARECSTTVAYAFDIPGADCTVKASMDTNLTIATTLEKKLLPLPLTLTLCCQGNQKKAQYITGIGLTIGS